MRTGTTPATLGELIVGEYTVTLLRPGWNPVTSTAKVSSLSTTQVVPLFPTARLMITSTPSGAAVMRNEGLLGTTPSSIVHSSPGTMYLNFQTRARLKHCEDPSFGGRRRGSDSLSRSFRPHPQDVPNRRLVPSPSRRSHPTLWPEASRTSVRL